ncbi:MAG: adenosylmethionine--8-amino-7-oxononanoate transaminase [Chlamydiota bacterium]|nr:adenosylmethionine--8-amino-7-oxononanoate transaminase [Chlamydiota bacterium]
MNKTQIRKLKSWDKRYLWHPFTQMQDWIKEDPLIIDSAKGSKLKDISGKTYIDGISSLWVNVHGHGVAEIDHALRVQLRKLAHSTLLGLGNTASILLAKKIIQIAPKGLSKVFYSDNGSTACEIALKMAYQYWQQSEKKSKRKYFITFSEAYHGDTVGSVSLGGIDLFHQIYKPMLFPVIRLPSPALVDCDGSASTLIKRIKGVLKKRNHEIIGIFMEPLIQGAAGMLTHPIGFLKEIRELCDQYGVLLILDEVATGFGRTGTMFACEQESVSPDIMAIAKGLSGGYLPIAATITTDKVFQAFLGEYADKKTFFHGHTYTGNPLACTAAIASIDLFKKKNILQKLKPKIKWMRDGLKSFHRIPIVGDIRQCGFMVGIELVKTPGVSFAWEERIGHRVILEARKRGAILRPLGNVVVIMPPLGIELKELRRLLRIVYESIQKVELEIKGGPGRS